MSSIKIITPNQMYNSKTKSLRFCFPLRIWQPTPVLLLENPMDRGAWWAAVHGVAKSHTRLRDFTFTFHFSLSCIGEGNGNPLQCSCLENPKDGRAWWAAVYGVAQSRTRLKRLRSSSPYIPNDPWSITGIEGPQDHLQVK